MEQTQTYTLAHITDEYLIQRMIRNRKYYVAYLVAAKWTWKDLFKNTIFSVQSEWQPLRKGEPYNYIRRPKGAERIFSISITDHCGNIVPLNYSNRANIISKPTFNDCGCQSCRCTGGLCEDVSGLTKLTKVLFTVNGVDYSEVTWLKFCPNGDIIEYREVPTKKFNSFTGDGGDYNNDYNNDYLSGNQSFSDFTITTEVFQKVLCKIKTKSCGCPENTVENQDLFLQYCGAYCQPFANCKTDKKSCSRVWDTINNNDCLGTVKLSDCGTMIFYIPPPHHNKEHQPKMPDFMLVNFQTNGEDCNSNVLVPEIAVETMFYGIDWRTKRFSGMLNFKEKLAVKYAYIDAQNELIRQLSPFNLDELAQIQDAEILF